MPKHALCPYSFSSTGWFALLLVGLLGCTPLGARVAPVAEGDAATDSGATDGSSGKDSEDSSKSDGAVSGTRGGGGGNGGSGGAGKPGSAGKGGASEVEAGSGADVDASTSAGGAGAGAGGAGGTQATPQGGAGGQGASGASGSAPIAGSGGAAPMGPCPDGAAPADEACDAKDNDCDGKVDESLARSCGPEAKGECKPGTETCSAGAWGACTGAVEAKAEDCDEKRLDENCDGSHNEGCTCIDGMMQACGKNTGRCKAGLQTCEGGKWSTTCNGAVDPMMPEVCDQAMVDENCDGRKNEGCECANGQSEECSSAALGPCKPGRRTCSNGKWGVCTSTLKPSTELCDGVDNNCDGTTDNSVTNCRANESCVSGMCKCTPQCSGKTCGPDGCGGRCEPDSCPAGQSCTSAGRCANSCGNGVIDSGEDCDDGTNAESGACPHCQNAFCGDGFIRPGDEECEQNAPGWGSSFCSPDCKRNVYKQCDASVSGVCSSEGNDANCSAWLGGTDESTYVCGAFCDASTPCPKPGGFDAYCSFTYCALLCKNGTCPPGMRCARNVPLGLPPDTVSRDVCVGG